MTEDHVSQVLSSFGELLRHDMTIFIRQKRQPEDTKLPIKVVGWVSGKFFLTTCPHENGTRLKLETGTDHDIIYLSRGNVYGIRTHLFREIHTMVPLLLFSYPGKVERVELRKEPRYTTFFAADIGSEAEGILELYKGTIVNLSNSGCLIKLSQLTAWPVGHEVNITFDMPTDNRQYSLPGIVRTIQRNKDIETLGIQFLDIPERFKDQIEVVGSVAEEAL